VWERKVRAGFDYAGAFGVLVVLTPIACFVSYRIGKMVGRLSG
jgi:hypothetical protein